MAHSLPSGYAPVDTSGGDVPAVVALVACHQGQSKMGVDHSWMTLLSDPILSEATFVDFRDSRKFERCPVAGSRLLSRNIGVALASAGEKHARDVPLLCLGGDHTISIGTFIATRKQHPNTRLVWIDAHPDINTPDDSLSGHCHGMPVAHLFNYVEGFKVDHPLQPHEIVYIGLRSIDDAEQLRLDYLRDRGACIYSASDVIERGMDCILAEVKAAWASSLNTSGQFDFPIHVSLDVDSMDPIFTPATGTPVPGGISPVDVEATLSWCNSHAWRGLCHLDIVEINCYLSTPSGAAKTCSSTASVLATWLATHRYFAGRKAAEDKVTVAGMKRARAEDAGTELKGVSSVRSSGSSMSLLDATATALL